MSLLRLAGLEFLAILGLFTVSVVLLAAGPWGAVLGIPSWLLLLLSPGIAAFFARRSGGYRTRGSTVVAVAIPFGLVFSLLAAQGVTSAASIAPAVVVGFAVFGGFAALEAIAGWWACGRLEPAVEGGMAVD